MGQCGSSVPGVKDEKIAPMENEGTLANTYKLIVNEKCPHIRVDSAKDVKYLKIDGERYEYTLGYCYVSQRGYYPHGNVTEG